MSELAIPDRSLLEEAAQLAADEPELVLPITGEIIRRDRPSEVAYGLDWVREAKRQLDDLRAHLELLLRVESQRQGSKTLRVGDFTAEITGGSKTVVDDPARLAHDLKAAGAPDETIDQAVYAQVEWKAKQQRLDWMAKANPAYAEVIRRHQRKEPTAWRVTVKRAGR